MHFLWSLVVQTARDLLHCVDLWAAKRVGGKTEGKENHSMFSLSMHLNVLICQVPWTWISSHRLSSLCPLWRVTKPKASWFVFPDRNFIDQMNSQQDYKSAGEDCRRLQTCLFFLILCFCVFFFCLIVCQFGFTGANRETGS